MWKKICLNISNARVYKRDCPLEDLHDDEELFNCLKRKPVVAWPTVILLFFCMAAIGNTWYQVIYNDMPLWIGTIINSIALYYSFSPLHDSMHLAVFRKNELNKITLALSAFCAFPLVTGQFARMMHMQHHRFLNSEKDPDHVVSKNWRNAFGQWFIWIVLYNSFFVKNRDVFPAFSKRLMTYEKTVMTLVLLLAIFYPGYIIMLILIPAMIYNWLIALVFMNLPHRPHTENGASNPYQATLVRQGWEWLLCPLMANQNYHLVHHLYPTLPFYRYRKVWKARERFHMSQNPTMVAPLQLNPN